MNGMQNILIKLTARDRSGVLGATMASQTKKHPAGARLAAISSHLLLTHRHTTSSTSPTSSQHSAPRPSSIETPQKTKQATTTTSQWADPHIYRYWVPVQTRWSDNDVYGHMNNTKYYELFDTIVNKFLREECGEEVPSMGLVVHSECDYMKPVGFPTVVILGLAVERIGRSSVVWRIGLWSTRSDYSTHESDHQTIVDTRDDEIGCHAFGNFVHVFVDHSSRQKIEISPLVRAGASRLLVDKQ